MAKVLGSNLRNWKYSVSKKLSGLFVLFVRLSCHILDFLLYVVFFVVILYVFIVIAFLYFHVFYVFSGIDFLYFLFFTENIDLTDFGIYFLI